MSGKYEPLSEYLTTLVGDEVCFTFVEIEAILGAPLPPTAWQRSMWWANSLRPDHPQSRAWLASGWKVSADVNNGAVTFIRSDTELDFPHLHGRADQVSPYRISRSQLCRDFSDFTPGHRYAKSRTRSLRWTGRAGEAL